MKRLTVLSADDYFFGNQIAKDLTELLPTLKPSLEVEFHSTNYAKKDFLKNEKERGAAAEYERSAEEIIFELNSIDIAFIDLVWDTEYDGTQGGANAIINMLKQKDKECCIVLLTNQQGPSMKFQKIEIDEGKYFFISKVISSEQELNASYSGLTNIQKEYFYKILDDWQISRVKKINNTSEWRRLLSAIENQNYSDKVVFYDDKWVIADFLFPETSLNGKTFFDKVILINEIKKLISYPKNKLWGTKDSWGIFTETYFKLIEIDEEDGFRKLLHIENQAKDYIYNFVDILISKLDSASLGNYSNRAKNNQLRSHQIKENDLPNISFISRVSDIPSDFYDILLIRYIVLTLYEIAERTNMQEWKNTSSIVELFDHTSTDSCTIKNFYYYSGFSTNRDKTIKHTSCIIDIFYKEKDFISSFNYQPILDKITANNQYIHK